MDGRRRALPVALAAAVAVLAGCDVRGLLGREPAPAPPPGPAPTAAPANGVAVGVTSVRVADNGQLGAIVVDNAGRTLYRYDRDVPRPPSVRCLAGCIQLWPPVRWKPGLKVTGVRRALVGRVARPDGTSQLTIAGWPMYRYARDTAPGDVRGQSASGSWFATTPRGTRARAPRGLLPDVVPGTRGGQNPSNPD
ncbi:hypothetical protein [Spirillospora sp. CA-294931]|uniref:hypothetical protein n=1 Tax=Spirillospora sp. CA-294931 TaxID=3240042 RepID=UPI003D93C394